jgi:hypothetical protein
VKTIGIDLWDGQVRGVANAATVLRPTVSPARKPRELFVATYAKFASACRAIEEPGVAIVAVHERSGRAAGLVKVLARVQRPVAAIVGRHDQCDLYLHASERLALRQLAVLLSPVESWEAGPPKVRYRVLDLRTSDGMVDEDGRALRGLRAEGPAILRAAGYTIFILTLGDPTDWPTSAEDAWDMLPERVYFDELENPAGGSLPRMRVLREGTRQSVIFRTQGPRDTGMGLGSSRDLVGVLELAGPHRHLSLSIGADALRDGVLLGRYARCDAAEDPDDPSLSRVHALLVHSDDRLLLIDTASYNGTRIVGEHRSRVIEIDRNIELQLGKHTRLSWRWVA